MLSLLPYVCGFKVSNLIIFFLWIWANPASLEVNGNFSSDLNERRVGASISVLGFKDSTGAQHFHFLEIKYFQLHWADWKQLAAVLPEKH